MDTWYVNGEQKVSMDPTTANADLIANGDAGWYFIIDLQVGSIAGPAPTVSGDMIVRYFRAWTL